AASGLQASLSADGSYQVRQHGWALEGRLPGAVAQPLSNTGQDRIGAYQELSFKFQDPAGPMAGRIRIYQDRALALFQQGALQALDQAPQPFPDFHAVPQGLSPFSYGQETFAPPRFGLEPGSNAWLLFDPRGRSLILSPASHFFTASMLGDGKARLAVGFSPSLAQIPGGFTQDSLLAFAPGINAAWDLWGRAMTDLQGKVRPANDADRVLKYFGYWTDAESAYWYHYEKDLGYQGTLQAVAASYQKEGIPLGYMQLDSWWYHKTLANPAGKLQPPKNNGLPGGDWNRYGGTVLYQAHPFIFPEGMLAFSRSIGLPVINHNRWIDPSSPYHQRYGISGLAAVDEGFWDEIAGYLQANGSFGYEQDWLSEITKHSPDLTARVGMDDQFLGTMADAFARRGMSLQYCMAYPMHFLQGAKYANLTTIRTSMDGFRPDHYRAFLYASRLAAALGIWPWTDVFKSADTDSLLLAVLSAGPVGTGDFLGQEDKGNILLAARQDGVLVKPDASLLPTDRSYLAEAKQMDRPLVAGTYTDHGGRRTVYAVAIRKPGDAAAGLSVEPSELGVEGPVYVQDYFAGTGRRLKAGHALDFSFNGRDVAFLEAAPIGASGMALLGDAGKFVGTGKQRIASIQDSAAGLSVEALFAPGEDRVVLHGYAPSAPRAVTDGGVAVAVGYDPPSGNFMIPLKAEWSGPAAAEDGGSRRLALRISVEKP
ncbi:MAG TPA: hypothetical protein VK842_08360, partial [bacterium]|nr:hypothetical protein [bacterium]